MLLIRLGPYFAFLLHYLMTMKIGGKPNSISNSFFQCFSFIIDRVHQNSPALHFMRANTDSGGPIRIQDGQYGFRRANTDSEGLLQIQEGQYETVYAF